MRRGPDTRFLFCPVLKIFFWLWKWPTLEQSRKVLACLSNTLVIKASRFFSTLVERKKNTWDSESLGPLTSHFLNVSQPHSLTDPPFTSFASLLPLHICHSTHCVSGARPHCLQVNSALTLLLVFPARQPTACLNTNTFLLNPLLCIGLSTWFEWLPSSYGFNCGFSKSQIWTSI